MSGFCLRHTTKFHILFPLCSFFFLTLTLRLYFFSSFFTIDKYETGVNHGHLNPAGECALKLNDSIVNGTKDNGIEVLVTTNISLELSGEANLHFHLKRSLNYDLLPCRPLSDFKFLRVNEFLTRLIQLRCSDFISPEWDYTNMADKCSRVLTEVGAKIMISNNTLQKHHSFELLDSFATLDHICTIS